MHGSGAGNVKKTSVIFGSISFASRMRKDNFIKFQSFDIRTEVTDMPL